MTLKNFNYNNYRPRVWMRLIDIKNYSINNLQSGELTNVINLYTSPSSRVTVENFLRIMLKYCNLRYRNETSYEFINHCSQYYITHPENITVNDCLDFSIILGNLNNIINSEKPSKEKILFTIIKSKNCHIIMKREKLGVYCFSYLEIEKLYKEGILEIDDSIINDNIAIISIVNRDLKKKDPCTDWTTIHPISDKHRKHQVLNLEFQDDSEDFSVEDAIKIIEFILYNKKLGRDFYVHCIMGKSRSQAVCRFILDTFPEDYKYKREFDNPLRTPNYHILGTLKLVWRDLYEDFTTSV